MRLMKYLACSVFGAFHPPKSSAATQQFEDDDVELNLMLTVKLAVQTEQGIYAKGIGERMEWAAVNLERAVVTVDAAASKVRRRRHVPLEPAAVELLSEAYRLGSTLPLSSGTRRTLCDRMRGVMGWNEWPQDVLRHTAASHLVALHQDVARVALVLGNSPGVLLTHYRNLVTPEECAEFWMIKPAQTVSRTLPAA